MWLSHHASGKQIVQFGSSIKRGQVRGNFNAGSIPINHMTALAFLHIGMLVAYVSLSCTGLVFMKRASSLMTPTFVFGFGMYGVGFLIWLAVLRRLNLSVAFPIAAGALVVGTIIAGYMFLDERVSMGQCFGALFIIVGMIVVYTTGVK